jgi:hypothetical protein
VIRSRATHPWRALPVPSLALAALLSLAPSPARADPWASISAGAYIPTGTTAFGTYSARATATVAVGYDWEYVGASAWAAVITTQAGLLMDTAFPVMARVRLRLPLGIAVPYVVGGVGLAPAHATVDLVPFDAVAFTAQAGGGIELIFDDRYTLGAEATYLWLSPSYSFGTVQLDGVVAVATLGLRFP